MLNKGFGFADDICTHGYDLGLVLIIIPQDQASQSTPKKYAREKMGSGRSIA